MEDEGIAPNAVRTADPVGLWKASRACTLYWNIECIPCWRDFLLIPTGTAVCICLNSPRLPFGVLI